MMRVASLESIQPQALQELNDILEKQFSGGSAAQTSRIGGVKRAADIMNFMDRSVEGGLMDSIKDMDPDLASTIEDLMFVFDNLKDIEPWYPGVAAGSLFRGAGRRAQGR